MASINIIALPGRGNILLHGPVPLALLRHRGEVWPYAWSSPGIAWRVRAPGPGSLSPIAVRRRPAVDALSFLRQQIVIMLLTLCCVMGPLSAVPWTQKVLP
jgi:hypothetical protein